MNKHVSFPLAKLLSEKSVEIEDSGNAWYNELGAFLGRTDLNKDGKTFSEAYPNEESHYGSAIKPEHKVEFKIVAYAAPKIPDVIMHMMKVYSVWVSVEGEVIGKSWYPKVEIVSNEGWANEHLREVVYLVRDAIRPKWFGSPAEAYEAVFTELLNRLV